MLVKAKTEERDGIEYFLFDRARLLSHGTTQAIFKSQFENELLLIDLRLHIRVLGKEIMALAFDRISLRKNRENSVLIFRLKI